MLFKENAISDIEKYAKQIGKKIIKTQEVSKEGTFESINEAENILKNKYTIGVMQINNPIGFADKKKYGRISKWANMNSDEHALLNGVIISDDFRNGSVTIVWWK